MKKNSEMVASHLIACLYIAVNLINFTIKVRFDQYLVFGILITTIDVLSKSIMCKSNTVSAFTLFRHLT